MVTRVTRAPAGDVGFCPNAALQVVLFELVRQFQVGHRLFGRLSRLERLASVFEKELIELAVIDEVLPRQRAARRVAGDDRVDILDCGYRFGDRVRIGDAASAVVSVNQRLAFVCEHISGMHRAQRAENNERIAIRMRGSEVKEVDRVGSFEERHLVFEGSVGQAVLVGRILEHVHLLHVGFLLRHNVDAGREEHIAACVIAVRVRVDDVRDGFAANALHLIQDRLAVVRELRVNDQNTIRHDEHRGVAAGAGDHIEPVRHFLNRSNRTEPGRPAPAAASGTTAAPALLTPAGLLCNETGGNHREPDANNHCQYKQPFHAFPLCS